MPKAPKDTPKGGERATVYALVDPRSRTIHYVGCTRNLKQRLATHMSEAKRHAENIEKYCDGDFSGAPWRAKSEWLSGLAKAGLEPLVIRLAEEPEIKAREIEKDFIALMGQHSQLCQTHNAKPYSPPIKSAFIS